MLLNYIKEFSFFIFVLFTESFFNPKSFHFQENNCNFEYIIVITNYNQQLNINLENTKAQQISTQNAVD